MSKISRICQKHLNIGEKHPKHIQNYLYIYLYFCRIHLDRPRRAETRVGRRQRKRSRDVANPKKRMLGVTPTVVCQGRRPENV